MEFILNQIKKWVPQSVKTHRAEKVFQQNVYAFEGEDLMLTRIFNYKTDGFYVDIGAFHPMQNSNTYYFYRRGWSGINVDAMPGSMAAFRQFRPRDLNVETAISTSRQALPYYCFANAQLNTADAKLAQDHVRRGVPVQETRQIEAMTLTQLLDRFLPVGKKIDFLSVDVEDHDLAVLQSNDFSKYRPRAIVVEIRCTNLERLPESETYQFLKAQGYYPHSKSLSNVVFVDERNPF